MPGIWNKHTSYVLLTASSISEICSFSWFHCSGFREIPRGTERWRRQVTTKTTLLLPLLGRRRKYIENQYLSRSHFYDIIFCFLIMNDPVHNIYLWKDLTINKQNVVCESMGVSFFQTYSYIEMLSFTLLWKWPCRERRYAGPSSFADTH